MLACIQHLIARLFALPVLCRWHNVDHIASPRLRVSVLDSIRSTNVYRFKFDSSSSASRSEDLTGTPGAPDGWTGRHR